METMTDAPRWAVVTGASSGIGAQLARLLAADGYGIALVARSKPELQKVAEDIHQRYQADTRVVVADLAKPEAARDVAKQVANLPVAVLINNAGVGGSGAFAERSYEQDDAMIQLNVAALTNLTKLLLPQLGESKNGRIMNLASTAAFLPGPYMAVYYATKAFVLSFSQALAAELGSTGITVTAVCPGPTRTNFEVAAGADGSRLFAGKVMDVETVARSAYRAMQRGQTVAVIGWRNKLTITALRFVPRSLSAYLASRANR